MGARKPSLRDLRFQVHTNLPPRGNLALVKRKEYRNRQRNRWLVGVMRRTPQYGEVLMTVFARFFLIRLLLPIVRFRVG